MRPLSAEIILVVAAVVERTGRFLLCQRPGHKRHGGLWEFPGGKLDPAESLEQAMGRELHEELGVSLLRVRRSLFVRRDPGSPFEIHFVEAEIKGEPEPLEHDSLRWVTLDEAAALPLAPSDERFVRHMLQSTIAEQTHPSSG
jgi:8-oxo-dGTP diphosphatase